MTELKIDLAGDRTTFNPGEELNGTASWGGEPAPRKLELRLFWFTRGKGIEDAGVVEHLALEQPQAQETRSFRFRLPPAPFSCVGSLVSVIWALELIAYPEKSVVRKEIEIGPGGKAVRLETLKPIGAARLNVQFGR